MSNSQPIKTSQIVWGLIGATALIVGITFLKKITFIFLLSFILSAALGNYISKLEKLKIPRIVSLLLIYISFILGLGLLVYFIYGPVFNELKELSINFTNFAKNLPVEYPILNKIIPQTYLSDWNKYLEYFLQPPLNFSKIIWGVFDNLSSIILIFVITFYLSLDPKGVEHFISFFTPKNKEEKVIQYWKRSKIQIYRWFNAQIILSFIIALLSFISLKILKIDYALILSIFSGILELLPIIGPILAGTLAVIIGMSQSFTTAIWIGIIYFLIQEIEAHILVPNIMKKAINFNPVVTIFLLLLGAKIGAGLLGMLIAIPSGIIFREIIKEANNLQSQK